MVTVVAAHLVVSVGPFFMLQFTKTPADWAFYVIIRPLTSIVRDILDPSVIRHSHTDQYYGLRLHVVQVVVWLGETLGASRRLV
jgi:hypothetical protein